MAHHNEAGGANLPAVPDTAVEEMIIDGEIIDETEAPATARPAVVNAFQTITVVVKHEHTRAAARHALYVPAGLVVACRRWQRRRSLAADMAQQARVQGDNAAALLLLQQAEAERKGRHERRVKTAELIIAAVKASPWFAAAALFLMVSVNVFLTIATHRAADLGWSFLAIAHAVQLGVEVASAVALALAVLGVLHHLGRTAGDLAPGWSTAAKPAGQDRAWSSPRTPSSSRWTTCRCPRSSGPVKTGGSRRSPRCRSATAEATARYSACPWASPPR